MSKGAYAPDASANKVPVGQGSSSWLYQLLTNSQIDPAAAIAYSKLSLALSIVNGDISASAAIALSKLAGYPTDATKFARGDGSWAVPHGAILAYGTKTSAVSTTATSFASGADVLASALSFTADGSSDYVVEISAPDWTQTSTAAASLIELNLDGSASGIVVSAYAPTDLVNHNMACAGRTVILAPSAGAHTVNLKLYCTTGAVQIDAGSGGAGSNRPILVTVARA